VLTVEEPHPNVSPEVSGEAMVKIELSVVSVSDAFCYSMGDVTGNPLTVVPAALRIRQFRFDR
jgi:hypothetical protein